MSYETVVGNGKYFKPVQPITSYSLGELESNVGRYLRDATRNASELGLSGGKGSSAIGAYQFTTPTIEEIAPQVYGDSWKSQKFTPDVQEALAKKLYELTPDDRMHGRWSSWETGKKKQGWDIDREYIANRESGGVNGYVPTQPTQAVQQVQQPIQQLPDNSKQLADAEANAKLANARYLQAMADRDGLAKQYSNSAPTINVADFTQGLTGLFNPNRLFTMKGLG